jgi:hypothetical protein
MPNPHSASMTATTSSLGGSPTSEGLEGPSPIAALPWSRALSAVAPRSSVKHFAQRASQFGLLIWFAQYPQTACRRVLGGGKLGIIS